jgi:fused signal recognition particle receptor
MDGTSKGGNVFAISQELKIPIVAISHGEKETDLEPFDPDLYVNSLI